MDVDPIRFATRASELAMAQARQVEAAVADRHRRVELVEVHTTGDELDDALIRRLGTTGAFVRSLDREVLDGAVHGAIHSMKDVPTEQPDELVIAAIPPRGPAGDVLVTPEGLELGALPSGAVVGTGSLRRRAQVLRRRPDLSVEPVRGNVDTRLAKLYAGFDGVADLEGPEAILARAADREVETAYDALVLARAGLERAGYAEATPFVPLEGAVPAPGQGALAVTTLDDDFGAWLNDRLDDPRTRVETTVERRILADLGAGCVAPLGIHAVIQGEVVQTRVQVLSRDGEDVVDATRKLPVAEHVEAAAAFARDLIDRGAAELIERAKRDDPGPVHRGS